MFIHLYVSVVILARAITACHRGNFTMPMECPQCRQDRSCRDWTKAQNKHGSPSVGGRNYLNELMLVSLLVIVSIHNGRSHFLIVFIHQFLWPLPLVIALRLTFMIVLNQKFLCILCAKHACNGRKWLEPKCQRIYPILSGLY